MKEKKARGGAGHKNQLFLGSSRQHAQSARVTLTADAILTFSLSFFKSHNTSSLCAPPTLYVFHEQFAVLKINATGIRLRQIFHLLCQPDLSRYDKRFKRGHWHFSTSVFLQTVRRTEGRGRKHKGLLSAFEVINNGGTLAHKPLPGLQTRAVKGHFGSEHIISAALTGEH